MFVDNNEWYPLSWNFNFAQTLEGGSTDGGIKIKITAV